MADPNACAELPDRVVSAILDVFADPDQDEQDLLDVQESLDLLVQYMKGSHFKRGGDIHKKLLGMVIGPCLPELSQETLLRYRRKDRFIQAEDMCTCRW